MPQEAEGGKGSEFVTEALSSFLCCSASVSTIQCPRTTQMVPREGRAETQACPLVSQMKSQARAWSASLRVTH